MILCEINFVYNMLLFKPIHVAFQTYIYTSKERSKEGRSETDTRIPPDESNGRKNRNKESQNK